MPIVVHLALRVSRPASRTHKSECYAGAYSWSLHVMHIWYQWLKSVKTSAINVKSNRQYMDHSLYLPKQYLTPCQSQQLKMRHILSHSWLNYNWRIKAATNDLHHHRSMQVKRDDHKFIRTVWKQRYTLQKQHSGYHIIYLEDYDIQRWMNKQTGFNADKLKRIIIQRVKPFED